jgi:hypothetical protein
LLKTNFSIPFSPFFFIHLDGIDCKDLKEKRVIKPYHLLILNKQQKETTPPIVPKNGCPNILLTNLNINKIPYKNPNKKINTVYTNIMNKIDEFWDKGDPLTKEIKKTFKDNHPTMKKKYPFLGEYLSKTKNVKNFKDDNPYSYKHYINSLFFDHYFLDETIDTIDINIKIHEEDKPFIIKTFDKKNIVIQSVDKGNDPFYSEFPFYDIEKKHFDSYIKNDPSQFNESSEKLFKDFQKRANNTIANPVFFEQKLSSEIYAINDNEEKEKLKKEYFDLLTKYYDNNDSIMGYQFKKEFDPKIVFYMIEDLKKEYVKKLNKIKSGKALYKLDEEQTEVNLVNNFKMVCDYYGQKIKDKLILLENTNSNDREIKEMITWIESPDFKNITEHFENRKQKENEEDKVKDKDKESEEDIMEEDKDKENEEDIMEDKVKDKESEEDIMEEDKDKENEEDIMEEEDKVTKETIYIELLDDDEEMHLDPENNIAQLPLQRKKTKKKSIKVEIVDSIDSDDDK